jgi:transcriptional regulator with XRE-family HTH domain
VLYDASGQYESLSLRGVFASFQMQATKPKNTAYVVNPITIGDHIRNVRLERRLLQKATAQLIEVGVSSIEHWEAGIAEPQLRFLPPIIKFLKYVPDCCMDIPQLKSKIFLKRVKLGITQKEMAKRIGIDQSTLKRIERNGKSMTRRTLILVRLMIQI